MARPPARQRPRTRRTRPRRRAPRPARDRRQQARAGRAFARLVGLMATLRSPGGCPWDREQTHESLRPFLIEESYEALDAIDRGEFDRLGGELGDVLFQCVFQAQIAAEDGRFEIADAIDAICAKLVRRHPHVFTPAGRPLAAGRRSRRLTSPDRVLEQWEQIKAREQRADGQAPRLLAGIPAALPALLRAHEIGTRVAAVGFDWPAAADVMDKIDEELAEFRAAMTESPARAAEELGDLLFSIANLSRKLGLESESALREANNKFTARYTQMEALLAAQGLRAHDVAPAALEAAWQAVKSAPAQSAATRARATSESRRPARRSRR